MLLEQQTSVNDQMQDQIEERGMLIEEFRRRHDEDQGRIDKLAADMAKMQEMLMAALGRSQASDAATRARALSFSGSPGEDDSRPNQQVLDGVENFTVFTRLSIKFGRTGKSTTNVYLKHDQRNCPFHTFG